MGVAFGRARRPEHVDGDPVPPVGDATLSEWTAWFDCDPELAGKMDHVIGNGIFTAGMQGLADFLSG